MVKLGDDLSVKSYVDRELALGNQTDEFKLISQQIDERIKIDKNKLKKVVDEYYGK